MNALLTLAVKRVRQERQDQLTISVMGSRGKIEAVKSMLRDLEK